MQQISLQAYLMGREKTFELLPDHRHNAEVLLRTVNAFLDKAGWTGPRVVSSGWRPAAINAKVHGAAKASLHMSCRAIDISDASGALGRFCMGRPELLKTYGLWLENPIATKGWCHLDIGSRPDRPSRIFNP